MLYTNEKHEDNNMSGDIQGLQNLIDEISDRHTRAVEEEERSRNDDYEESKSERRSTSSRSCSGNSTKQPHEQNLTVLLIKSLFK